MSACCHGMYDERAKPGAAVYLTQGAECIGALRPATKVKVVMSQRWQRRINLGGHFNGNTRAQKQDCTK
jgi:hypothetical protein